MRFRSVEQVKSKWTLPRFTVTLATAVVLSAHVTAAPQPPNVIVILIDDMGWADSSTYGSEFYQTPNLTRLAEEGMRFTDAYAASPLCSPTRASIMSGQYPARLRITVAITPKNVAEPKALPPEKNKYCGLVQNKNHMPLEVFTLAEALKEKGYNTAHIGKWHLAPPGDNWSNKDEAFYAENQGFDFVIGGAHLPGPPDYYSPYLDTNSGRTIRDLSPGPEGEYLNERLVADHNIAHFDQPFNDLGFFKSFTDVGQQKLKHQAASTLRTAAVMRASSGT